METLNGDPRVRAFRAADAFTLEVYRASNAMASGAHRALVREMRRAAMRSGGAVVAASANPPGAPEEQRLLERARTDLFEGRYYLYLARRLGLLDARRYRALTLRQDAALRELDALLRPGGRPPPA